MEILLIAVIFFAVVCALWANWKGRNPILAALLGALFGIFALIGYMIAGESEEKKRDRIRSAMRSE